MYRIGEFAALGQVSVKALRLYDEIGLLRPAWTDPRSGYRYYAAAQVGDLNRIASLKELGLSLAEIGAVMAGVARPGSDAGRELVETLERKRAEAERGIVAARARLDRIDEALARVARGEEPSPFRVVTKRVPPRRVASLRDRTLSVDDVDDRLDEVERYARRHGARGRRAALYHGCDPATGALDCESLLLVDADVPEAAPLRVYDLPAARVVSTVFAGPVAGAPAAFAAVERRARDDGLALAGHLLEVYLRGTLSSEEIVLEIQLPVIDPAAGEPPVH